MDCDALVDELHAIGNQTAAGVLRATVLRYSAYQQTLTQRLSAGVLAGGLSDAVMDHMYVTTELLSRAVGRLAALGVVEVRV
jgi:hypothetical protein